MRNLKTVWFILLLQLAAGSAVLHATQDPPAHNEGAGNSSNYVQREVRHELMSVPWYSVFDIIKYNVSGDEVTLTGAVVNPW